jgi:hypothetical protein
MMLREHPLGKGKARLTLSSIEYLKGFWTSFVGILAISLEFLLLLWSLVCILHVYLGTPYAF